MRLDRGTLLVAACAFLTLSGASLLCCPTARAGSPASAPAQAHSAAAPAPTGSEDSLDDDRAEHWDVPGIAREERVQSGALAVALLGAGALSARRRSLLKARKRQG